MENLRENVKCAEERKIMEIISNKLKEREKNSIIQRLVPKQKSMVKKMNEDTKMLNRFGRCNIFKSILFLLNIGI